MKRFALILIFIFAVGGIVVGTNISHIEPLFYFLILGLIAFVALHFLKHSKGFAALCIVFALFSIYAFLLNVDPYVEQIRHSYTARVIGEVKENNRNYSFIADNITVDGKSYFGKAYCTIRKEQKGSSRLSDGALISFEGKGYFPQTPKGKYSFDFNRYLKQKKINLAITSIKELSVLNERESYYPYADIPFRLRQAIRNIFANNISPENARIASSLILSSKNNDNNQFMTMFSRMGIAHIFSVSGLHVSIVALSVLNLLKKFHLKKIVSSSLALSILALYCYITGFGPATMRAFIMFAYLMLANNINARYQLINGLALSGIIIALINPFNIFTQGFIFSFSAVLGIYLFDSAITALLHIEFPKFPYTFGDRVKYAIAKTFTLSLSAQLGILIPCIHFYGEINLLSIFFNVLTVPIISIYLMPLSLISVLISYIPIISNIAFYILNASISLFIAFLKLVNLGVFIRLSRPSINALLFIVFTIFIFQNQLFNLSLKKKLLAMLSMLFIVVSSAVISYNPNPKYIQLSVGRADSAVIDCSGKAVIIDTGEMGTELLNYIKHNNLSVEDIYISHADSDHYGGLSLLLQNNINVKNIYIACGTLANDKAYNLSDLLAEYSRKGSNIEQIGLGFNKDYGKYKLKALYPKVGRVIKNRPTNDNSLVLLIDFDKTKLLTTGDLPKNYERYISCECDILKVGHHGSNTSSSEEFLKKSNASVALISANNTEGFPSDKVINRLKRANVHYYNTGEIGDIIIRFEEGKYSIE